MQFWISVCYLVFSVVWLQEDVNVIFRIKKKKKCLIEYCTIPVTGAIFLCLFLHCFCTRWLSYPVWYFSCFLIEWHVFYTSQVRDAVAMAIIRDLHPNPPVSLISFLNCLMIHRPVKALLSSLSEKWRYFFFSYLLSSPLLTHESWHQRWQLEMRPLLFRCSNWDPTI